MYEISDMEWNKHPCDTFLLHHQHYYNVPSHVTKCTLWNWLWTHKDNACRIITGGFWGEFSEDLGGNDHAIKILHWPYIFLPPSYGIPIQQPPLYPICVRGKQTRLSGGFRSWLSANEVESSLPRQDIHHTCVKEFSVRICAMIPKWYTSKLLRNNIYVEKYTLLL